MRWWCNPCWTTRLETTCHHCFSVELFCVAHVFWISILMSWVCNAQASHLAKIKTLFDELGTENHGILTIGILDLIGFGVLWQCDPPKFSVPLNKCVSFESSNAPFRKKTTCFLCIQSGRTCWCHCWGLGAWQLQRTCKKGWRKVERGKEEPSHRHPWTQNRWNGCAEPDWRKLIEQTKVWSIKDIKRCSSFASETILFDLRTEIEKGNYEMSWVVMSHMGNRDSLSLINTIASQSIGVAS